MRWQPACSSRGFGGTWRIRCRKWLRIQVGRSKMPTQPYRTKNGKRVPGVTTILSRFKDSGGLIWWANRLALEPLLQARHLLDLATTNGDGNWEKNTGQGMFLSISPSASAT